MKKCKNCDIPINGNYCSNCGRKVELKRIDSHYIFSEIQNELYFENGILYTIKELLIRPGKNINEFITEDRNRLVKPIIFIIATSLIYTLINQFFRIEESYIKFDDTSESTTVLIFKWIQSHYGYANIIIGIFIAFWVKLFFRKYHYNFFEILILLCFLMGIGMLLFSVFALVQGLTNLNLMKFSGILAIVYFTWAIGQFFDRKKAKNYLKALVSYFLGMISFAITAILLGVLIDLIIK